MVSYAYPMVFSVASNMYGPEEAKRRMAELYGFADERAAVAQPEPDRGGMKSKIGGGLSVIVAASLAIVALF